MINDESIVVFFNSPLLGGAERSLSLQLRDVLLKKNKRVFVVIPYLHNQNESNHLLAFLLELGLSKNQVTHFQVDFRYYQWSRDHRLFKLLRLFSLIFVLWGYLNSLKNWSLLNLPRESIYWIGGNKVGFLVFMGAWIQGFKKTMLWHFRDYLPSSFFVRYVWHLLFRIPRFFDLKLIGNSYDVAKTLKNAFPHIPVLALYNPVIVKSDIQRAERPQALGTAALFSHWKGIHALILFVGMYRKELEALGFKQFFIYGKEVYQTSGRHQSIEEDLKSLAHKCAPGFISFLGLKSPEEIFNHLDVFIHYSLKPEPFGRVVVESFAYSSALISTGLGGAQELIQGNAGYQVSPFDYAGLYEKIESLCQPHFYRDSLEQGRERFKFLQEKYHQQLADLFKN